MVSVWRASGAQLVTIPLEELSDVLTLKRYLQGICGRPRFQQRLLYDGMDLKDSFKYPSPMDVQLVLLPLSDASESERRELLDAVSSVQVLEIEKILQRPQDPNLADFSGNTPLARATMQGNLDIMRLLLEASASPNALSGPPDWTPLHSASLNGHVEGVSLLLQFRADMNLRIRNGATALHVASVLGQPEIVSLLLEAGAPKNSQLDNGMTPLHVASAHGHSEAVRVLLKARVDLTSNQRKGRTALHSAAKKGHVLVVQMLLEAGLEKEVPQKDGSTALHIASKHGQAEVVRLLLRLRARPNLRQLAGKTALHFASRRGHVDAGSEKEGVLAASAAGHVEVVRLLYEFKADERLRPTGVVVPLSCTGAVEALLSAGAPQTRHDFASLSVTSWRRLLAKPRVNASNRSTPVPQPHARTTVQLQAQDVESVGTTDCLEQAVYLPPRGSRARPKPAWRAPGGRQLMTRPATEGARVGLPDFAELAHASFVRCFTKDFAGRYLAAAAAGC
eukprot:s2952_g5.t2